MTCNYNAMSDDAGIKHKSHVVLNSKTLSTTVCRWSAWNIIKGRL